MTITVEMPIKTGQGQNDRGHKMKLYRLGAKRRADACMLVKSAWWSAKELGPEHYATRFVVTLTRISPGVLDSHDNLAGSLKNVVDGIADALQVNDGGYRVQWRYAQEKCKRGDFGVRVQIETMDDKPDYIRPLQASD